MDTRKRDADQDGVRVVAAGERRGLRAWLAVAAVAAVVIGVTALVVLRRESGTEEVVATAAPPPQAPPPAAMPAARPPAPAAPAVERAGAAGSDRAADSAPKPARKAATSEAEQQAWVEAWARDAIEAMRASGETGGLAAFPPPGTDPIKIGLVVPKDFELPKGYVRHYQTTDDGRRLEPILMFSPDQPPLDENGKPMAVTSDGIVPPDMAPPGLPLRMLDVPNAPQAAGPASGADAP